MRPREVKNLPRVTQLVRAELGFKSDSHEPAFSRMPLPTHGSCIFHKNSWQCPKTLSSPLRIGWAKGAYFVRCSHGILLLLTLQAMCATESLSHSRLCVQFLFLSTLGAHVQVEIGHRVWRKIHAFCASFDSSMYPLSHFIPMTTLVDKNCLHYLDEETGQVRQTTLLEVRWLVSARELVWTYGSTSLEGRLQWRESS